MTPENLSLKEGGSSRLTVAVQPSDATDKSVIWSSDNPDVATVSDGMVTAVKEGSATVKVTTKDGGKNASCSVTVTRKEILPTGIVVEAELLTVMVNQTKKVSAKVMPENATETELEWSVAKTTYAIIDAEGNVTGKSEGTTSIIVRCKSDHAITKSIPLEVTPDLSLKGITVNPLQLDLPVGKETQLGVVCTPATAQNKKVTWSSSDRQVATVDENGLVKALKEGTADIKAVSEEGGFESKCSLKVTAKKGTDVYAYLYSNSSPHKIYVNGSESSLPASSRFFAENGHFYYYQDYPWHKIFCDGDDNALFQARYSPENLTSFLSFYVRNSHPYVLFRSQTFDRVSLWVPSKASAPMTVVKDISIEKWNEEKGLCVGKDDRVYSTLSYVNSFGEWKTSYWVTDMASGVSQETCYASGGSFILNPQIAVTDANKVYTLVHTNDDLYALYENGTKINDFEGKRFKSVSLTTQEDYCYVATADASDKTIRVYKNGQPMDGQTFSCTVNPWVFAIQVTKNGDVYLAATRNDVWTDGGIFKNGTMITKAPDNCWFSTLQLDE